MKGEWKVMSNCIGADKFYQVARVRDVEAVMHSGNLEYVEGVFELKDEAQETADQMNESEKIDVKRLIELNTELIELYKKGILSACGGEARIHVTQEAFEKITKGMHVEKEAHSEKHVKCFVTIDGVRIFHLEEVRQ
ncbi:hypothetical protein M2140_001957 [Clostridiales Family XIII bacterium PM5-7]